MANESKKKVLFLAVVAFCVSFLIEICYSKRITFFSVERPEVTWFDPKHLSNVIFKSRRVSRNDPVHYVTLNYTSLIWMDNSNVTVHIFFYQLLSNVYKRSFVDLHVKVCDLYERDEIIGDAFRAVYYRIPEKERVLSVLKCPYPPGFYSFLNMKFKLTALAESFPFQEGRVYVNITLRGTLFVTGHVDFAIKVLRLSRNDATGTK